LEQLLEFSARIGRMELGRPVQVKTALKEIDNLAQAQESMRKNLLKATNDLKDANESLEQKVAERTEALEASEGEAREAVRQLEAGARDKTEFIARVSHEIRTPMTVIAGLSHLGMRDVTKEKRLEYLEKISVAVAKSTAVIDDLLDAS